MKTDKSDKGIDQIYFAFPDGVLHYVCAECTALCCKGLGFGGSMSREMPFLLKQYPSINAMVGHRTGDLILMTTPWSGCSFLQSDNRCRIEAEYGPSRKPTVCVLFPFNLFYRLGRTVVVSPHFRCPLRIEVPARVGEVEGTFTRIEGILRETGVLDKQINSAWMTDLITPRYHTPESIIERETHFRDRCARALGHERFADVLEGASKEPKNLRTFRKRAAALLLWKHGKRVVRPDKIDDVMLAIAPSVRIMNLDHSSEHQLRFLAIAESYVRAFFANSPAPPTPQAVYSIFEHSMPALKLLAHDDTVLKAKTKTPISPLGSAEIVFAASVAIRRMRTNGALNALESATSNLRSAADRLLVVNEVARIGWKAPPSRD